MDNITPYQLKRNLNCLLIIYTDLIIKCMLINFTFSKFFLFFLIFSFSQSLHQYLQRTTIRQKLLHESYRTISDLFLYQRL